MNRHLQKFLYKSSQRWAIFIIINRGGNPHRYMRFDNKSHRQILHYYNPIIVVFVKYVYLLQKMYIWLYRRVCQSMYTHTQLLMFVIEYNSNDENHEWNEMCYKYYVSKLIVLSWLNTSFIQSSNNSNLASNFSGSKTNLWIRIVLRHWNTKNFIWFYNNSLYIQAQYCTYGEMISYSLAWTIICLICSAEPYFKLSMNHNQWNIKACSVSASLAEKDFWYCKCK